MRAYLDDLDKRFATIADLHKAINRKFEQAGISIAYPQRDLRLDNLIPVPPGRRARRLPPASQRWYLTPEASRPCGWTSYPSTGLALRLIFAEFR